ncbi:MAG: FtsH protease activity modulator HflK [Burkholderiales bacterium]|nr:FtsH protease activity modulator HflK [Burkholderiales bacterium]MDE2609435.1 FtsH protease activity modulator HflK [Burkholderiales bacterium]
MSAPVTLPLLMLSKALIKRLGLIFSLNDPRWGRGDDNDARNGRDEPNRQNQDRPPEGPPDLDELWRDFNRRLNRLFGRNNNGGDAGGKLPSSGRGSSIGVGVVIIVAVLVWLATGVFIVQEGQVGVVMQFGKYKYTTTSGIQWRLPYPFQSEEVVNMSQIRSVEIGRSNVVPNTDLKDSSMLTGDENIVDVRFAVQYRVKDASEFLFNNVDPEASVSQAAATAVREIVGKSKMDYVLYAGREEIANELVQSIQRILDSYKTGILVTSVTMQSVQPPEQVQAAFDDAVKAGQDRERQKNEAQAYANNVIPLAKGTAARLLEEASGYKSRVIEQAQGDAERFKLVEQAYAQAPEVTRERMYLNTMEQIYSHTTKILVDTHDNKNLLYLPLNKLLEQSKSEGGDAAPAPKVPQNHAAAPAPDGSGAATGSTGETRNRSRNALRDSDPLRSGDSQ